MNPSLNILLMYVPSPEHSERLRQLAPDATFRVARDAPEAARLIVDADAVLGNRFFLQSLPHARRLRWMQSNSMGVDVILRGAGDRLGGVTLTCARGLYSDELADHALALVLGVTRGLRDAVEHYGDRQWGRWSLPTLQGRRCLLLGYGETGRAVARRLLGFGVECLGVRRHAGEAATTDDLGVTVLGPDHWRSLLPSIDLLVVTLPRTRETEACVGAAELADLPAHAIVVNVGRGGVVDERALFERLRNGCLWGAGLDTIEREPPGPDDEVWSVPRLLLTPHVGRSLEQGPPRFEGLFEENVRRFLMGEPLLHVVDQELGY